MIIISNINNKKIRGEVSFVGELLEVFRGKTTGFRKNL